MMNNKIILSRSELIQLVNEKPELLKPIVDKIGFDPRDASKAAPVKFPVPFSGSGWKMVTAGKEAQ